MQIGDRIGPYEIREPLGQGGMAQVWKAWHLGLHRFEALKIPVMRGAKASSEAEGESSASEQEFLEFIARFLHEARIAASLRHVHIATIYSVSEADAPQPFFAMELVEGGDLAALIRARGRLALDEALSILEAVGSALDYAHDKGVVHRDIKPANVLLEASPLGWSPKVVDFGIARAAQGSGEANLAEPNPTLQEGSIAGTPEYMSPEQAGSGEEVGPRSDLYSLATVAYEMLCGRPPFSLSLGASPISILVQHRIELPPRPSTWYSDLAPGLNDVLLWALDKSPAARPASCAEFLHALRDASQRQAQAQVQAQVLGGTTEAPSEAPPSTWGQHSAATNLTAATFSASDSNEAGTEVEADILAAPISPAASTSVGLERVSSAPTIVQPVEALTLRASSPGAKELARENSKSPLRWLVPASAISVLSVGAALVAAEMRQPAPSPSTSGTPESTAQSSSTSQQADLDPTPNIAVEEAAPTGAPDVAGNVVDRAEDAEDEARRERAEELAQRVRREKIEVIDSLLVLRKRQEGDLLRPAEAAASRRKLLGRLAQALAQSETAIELDEDNETAWEQKAALLFLMGRFEQSYGTAKQGLQKFPGNTDLKDARDKSRDRLSRTLQRGA